ncbi:MAG: hypothetical protein KDJ75_10070 [Alphaproteobacteria bacterium]|nr:hypothetical protein [Alphaproteobacteria bacterium]
MIDIPEKLEEIFRSRDWQLGHEDAKELIFALEQAGLVIVDRKELEDIRQAVKEHQEADDLLYHNLTLAEAYWRDKTGRDDGFTSLAALLAFLVERAKTNDAKNDANNIKNEMLRHGAN